MITDEQLANNQKFIDFVDDFNNDNPHNYFTDGKMLMKFIWNRGYKLVPREEGERKVFYE